MTEVMSRGGSGGLDRGGVRVDPRHDTIGRWSAALARGDEAEVDRLVRQSRIDRAWVATSGQIGAMVDLSRSAAPDDGSERALLSRPVLLADATHQTGGAS